MRTVKPNAAVKVLAMLLVVLLGTLPAMGQSLEQRDGREIRRIPREDVQRAPGDDVRRSPRDDVRRVPRRETPREQPDTRRPDSGDKDESRTDGKVQLKVLAIIATNEDDRIDPALRDLAKQLKPTLKFRGYRLAGTDSATVESGKTAQLKLAGPYSLKVTPGESKDGRVTLRVQALNDKKEVLNLTVRLRPGKYQLLGGWDVKEGKLLAAVTVVK